jgi:4,5-DOPA dioxygenase extradiol
VDRRTALKLAGATSASLLASCARRHTETKKAMSTTGQRMPSIFLAHGSPLLLDDATWIAELGRWAHAMPRPKSVLMISAHWLDEPVTLGATVTVPLVYDFYGFPQKYYEVTYPAPGAPDLAKRTRELLSQHGPVADDPTRGLDHGAYVPMVAMYPDADVPTLQVSIPTMDPTALIDLGRALAPLRDEGVLIIGSGFLTHNLRTIDWNGRSGPASWAADFDAWAKDAIAKRDVDEMVQYRTRAPGVRQALPTQEHFVPVLVALGASLDTSEPVTFPITGFAYGTFTKRSVQFG